jgi:hypothetical protein
MRQLLSLCVIVGFAAIGSPARAGCDGDAEGCYWRAHSQIYHMQNRIAYLQARPDADDNYKGPIIEELHVRTLQARAVIGPRWPHWPTPCCYSRRPIYIH